MAKSLYPTVFSITGTAMDQKVCLFTGASSGIGAFTVEFLVKNKGWKKLSLVARRKDKLEEVAAKCRAAGATDVLVLSLDMFKERDCIDAVEKTVSHFGRE
jgi:NADP-dependent 3-hydroxy acid dehydrogenase YdfG